MIGEYPPSRRRLLGNGKSNWQFRNCTTIGGISPPWYLITTVLKSNSLQEEFPGLLCVLKLRNTIPIHVCNRQTESTPKSNSCWLLSAVRKIVKRTPGSITDVAPVVDQVR